MYYMQAERHNGQLILDTVSSFKNDSKVFDEPDFLTIIRLMDDDEMVYGIVDEDTYDVLMQAYKF